MLNTSHVRDIAVVKPIWLSNADTHVQKTDILTILYIYLGMLFPLERLLGNNTLSLYK